jgi:NhaP-type Na+/H+ or K+/H+ antiporter
VTLPQNSINALLLVLGGTIIWFSPFSLFVKSKLLLSDSLVATLIGITFGPVAINLFNPFLLANSEWINIVFVSSSILLAIQIIAATIELPRKVWTKEWQTLLMLLGPITFYTWAVCTLIVWACCGVSFLTSLMVGAIISPTDPILVGTILKGRFAENHISPSVRNILTAESAGNDGIALPLVLLAVYLLRYYEPDTATDPSVYPFVPSNASSVVYTSVGEAILAWFLEVFLYQVCVGAIAGLALGYVFRHILTFSQLKGWIDHESILSFSFGLAFFTLGGCNTLSLASFIACFFAGVMFVWSDDFIVVQEIQEAHIQEVIDLLLSLCFFIFFGSTIPWDQFNTPRLPIWRLVILSVAYMVLHRLPAVMLVYRWLPGLRNHKEAWFVGYFGPTAVGSLSYATFTRIILPNGDPRIIPIIWWLVLTSIVLHGLSVPFTHLTLLTISRSRDPVYRGPRAPEGSVLRTTSVAESSSGTSTEMLRDAQGRKLTVSGPMVDEETRQKIREQLNNPDSFGPGLEMTHVRGILANTDYQVSQEDGFHDALEAQPVDLDPSHPPVSVRDAPRVSFGVSRVTTDSKRDTSTPSFDSPASSDVGIVEQETSSIISPFPLRPCK